MTVSRRFEVKLRGTSEKAVLKIPAKWRSQFIRQAIVFYSMEITKNIKPTDNELKEIIDNFITIERCLNDNS